MLFACVASCVVPRWIINVFWYCDQLYEFYAARKKTSVKLKNNKRLNSYILCNSQNTVESSNHTKYSEHVNQGRWQIVHCPNDWNKCLLLKPINVCPPIHVAVVISHWQLVLLWSKTQRILRSLKIITLQNLQMDM